MQFQMVLIERIVQQLEGVADALIEIDARRELFEDETGMRFAEEECKFEAAFEEIDTLRRRVARNYIMRNRRIRNLGGAPPV